MKTKRNMILLTTMFVLLSASVALAHEWTGYLGTEGWGMGHPYQKMYNPQGTETVSGEVVSVDTVVPMKGMSAGVHLTLLTKDKKAVSVHLGPVWFVERLDTQIKKGDEIEVKGSTAIMNIEEKPEEMKAQHVLIASEVRKDDKVLILRDALGEPVWSGWRKTEK